VLFFALPELGIIVLGVGILMIAGEFDLSVGSVFALVPMVIVVAIGRWGFDPYRHGAGLRRGARGRLHQRLDHAHLQHPELRHHARHAVHGPLAGDRALRRLSAALSRATCPTAVFVADLGLFRSSMLWFVGFALILGITLHYSNLGNWIFATGGQRQAAADMGIDTRRVKMACFMLCSFMAGFAGMITTFRLRSALPSLGEGLELQAIAAAVIGGTALDRRHRLDDRLHRRHRPDPGHRQRPRHGPGRCQLVPLRHRRLTILAVILNIWVRNRARRMH
jgi:simple sugar transport system permease protein